MADFLAKQFNLSESILATLAYFDTLHYPLTIMELSRCLLKSQASVVEVEEELEKLVSEKKIQMDKGFYFLPQTRLAESAKRDENLAELRLKNYSFYAIPYGKKVKRAVAFLQWIPFLRFVGVCNNLAINNVDKQSDIDLLIMAKKGYLWIVRFGVVIILSILGLRHYGRNVGGKICLSFYIADDGLNLEPVAKKPYDIYLNYWVAQIVPVFDEGVYQKFLEANLWVKELIPAYPEQFNRAAEIKPIALFVKMIRKMKELFLSFGIGFLANRFLRWLQLKRLKKSQAITPKHYADKDVVVNDKMLKFYLNDKRDYYRNEFEKHLRDLNLIS